MFCLMVLAFGEKMKSSKWNGFAVFTYGTFTAVMRLAVRTAEYQLLCLVAGLFAYFIRSRTLLGIGHAMENARSGKKY